MAQKKYSSYAVLLIIFFAALFFNVLAAEEDSVYPRSVELTSSEEFSFTQQDSATFTIRPLKPELRSIDNLSQTEAVGVVYLGNIELSKSATPLSALRNVSVQISKGLDLDLALITDSTTSQSLAPHELLLLYHPNLVITLALTKAVEINSDADENSAADSEETSNDEEEESDTSESSPVISGTQYSLIGTYAIPPKPMPELISPSEEVAEEIAQEIVE